MIFIIVYRCHSTLERWCLLLIYVLLFVIHSIRFGLMARVWHSPSISLCPLRADRHHHHYFILFSYSKTVLFSDLCLHCFHHSIPLYCFACFDFVFAKLFKCTVKDLVTLIFFSHIVYDIPAVFRIPPACRPFTSTLRWH